MLNVPTEVQALFKADSVFKNFRVHFPNGENADLTNDDIVSESVSFTESICSAQVFQFGLTEASEIKFTCVNVPNIRGAVIECAIEVQADSLGAEWLAEHAPTGNEEFLDPQVCVYGSRNMYRVPYGRFIVDTCPRNHETMYKRDVTAYTERMDNAETLNPGQVAVMNAFYPELETYSPRVKALFWATVANNNPTMLTAGGYEPATLTADGSDEIGYLVKVKNTSGTTFDLYAVVQNSYYVPAGTASPETDIYSIEWGDYWTRDYVQELANVIENSIDVNLSASGYASYYDLAMDLLRGFHLPKMRIQYGSNTAYQSIPQGTNVIYPHATSGDTVAAAVPSVIYLRTNDGLKGAVDIQRVAFSMYTDTTAGTDPTALFSVSFSSTLETNGKLPGQSGKKMYSFANAFSLGDIVQGYLELQCRFGSPSRTGGMEITALDNTSPVSILPENYAELWYDETTIAPIGYVQVKFKDETDNEQDLTVQIGTGASVYDLRDNAVLQNMVFTVSKAEAEAGITIESKLLAFLNSVFTPNIPDLTFIPIELSKKGLPYLEAGDAVTITTGDGQVVPSFILRQTVKGIQFLTADVESANGEAVEMVET